MTAIVVLGMHRSGTSLIAGLLHYLGVYMGDNHTSPDESRPWGNFEDRSFVSLNQQLLTAAGGSWRKPPSTKSLWAASHPFNERIQRLIRDRSNHPLWGFKDSRTCLTASLWHHHLCLWEKPKYIMVWRDRDAIAASLIKRVVLLRYPEGEVRTEAQWGQLIGIYWARVMNFLCTYHPESHAVWFDEILCKESSAQSVQGLAKFCGVDYNPDVLSFVHRGSDEHK